MDAENVIRRRIRDRVDRAGLSGSASGDLDELLVEAALVVVGERQ